MQGISSATPTHRFEKLPFCTPALHILRTNTETHGSRLGPRGRHGLDVSPEERNGACFVSLCAGAGWRAVSTEQTSWAAMSQEGISLEMFPARGGPQGGIFREQRSLKHCTDWGSFETFPCPRKGDPPLKHLQAPGSPPGSKSKTFSSSCCLCTCSPPVALTWQCLKPLPLTSPVPPTSHSL